MRGARRNQQRIWHSEYLKTSHEIEDEYGNKTGEYVFDYSEPSSIQINIAPPTGEVSTESFGGVENYDAVLLTFDKQCPLRENSRIWWGIEKEEPYNFEVVKMAESLNVIRYAVAKVKVNG